MKFSTNPTGRMVAAMSEGEILGRCIAFEQYHDAVEGGCDTTALEIFDNLKDLKDRIVAKDPGVNAFISSQPELVDMLKEAKSLENFMVRLDNEMRSAEEGFGKDLLFEGLIGAILHRNDATVEHLEPLIPQLIKQVEEADEKKFGQWKVLGQINVFSKYLPDQKDWAPAAKALKAAANYLKNLDPNKFDSGKFNGFFNGTVYMNKRGKVGTTTTVGAAWWGTRDIRQRGWTEKKHFLVALKDMQEIVKLMKALGVAEAKHKNIKIKEDYKDAVKACASALAMTVNLCGHLGRGITAAASKISGSVWKRIFTTEV